MENYSLLRHNAFGMNVSAKRFFEYSSVDELRKVIACIPSGDRILHIGAGSNLLFTGDFEGTILHSNITTIECVGESDEDVLLRVGAGVVWDDFVRYCVSHGYYGVENLSLIPGEVGASAVQNIGAYGVEVKDVIDVVETIAISDGKERVFSRKECEYGYRRSVFKERLKGEYAVVYVTYRLSKIPSLKLSYGNILSKINDASSVTLKEVRDVIVEIRKEKLPDPEVMGNAGSFFMNPVVDSSLFQSLKSAYPDMPYFEVDGGVKIPAGWMIEQCGWKGKSLGNAAVHDKQALVIVNKGGATSGEIIAIAEAVRKSVKDKFGIDIIPEVNYI